MRHLKYIIPTLIISFLWVNQGFADIVDDEIKIKHDHQNKVVCVLPAEKQNCVLLRDLKKHKEILVEIRHLNGDFVGYTKMKRRNLTIDFSKVKPGEYMVVILGDNQEIQNFKYIKE